jgi:hypothetical protein
LLLKVGLQLEKTVVAVLDMRLLRFFGDAVLNTSTGASSISIPGAALVAAYL